MQAIKYDRNSKNLREDVKKNFVYFAPQSSGRTFILFMIMLFTINLALVDGRYLKSSQQHMKHRYRRTTIRGCGSQMVDFLTFLCNARVYEPGRCMSIERYFCNPRVQFGCNFNCGRSKKSE